MAKLEAASVFFAYNLGQLRHGTDRRTDLGIAYGGGHKNSNNDCVAVAAIDVKKVTFFILVTFFTFLTFF